MTKFVPALCIVLIFLGTAPLETHAQSRACLALSRNLDLGSTDAFTSGEVTRLQQYLVARSYLSTTPTGYYGPLTRRAVERWQSENGVVSSGDPYTTGYGRVGPSTRSMLARCAEASSTTNTPSTDTYATRTSDRTPVRITSFTSSSSRISAGGKAVLSWDTKDADGCQLRLEYSGRGTTGSSYLATLSTSGTYTVSPTTSTTYELYCSRNLAGGGWTFDSKKITVSVGDTSSGSSTKAPSCELSVTTPHGTRHGLTGTGYYDGSGSGYVEVYSGDPVTIKFSSTNATYSAAPYGDKDVTSGSATYRPTTDTAYVWTFYGPGGSTKCGVKVEIRPPKSSSTTGSYRGYLNGSQFIATNDITRDAALSNCKLNAANNPSSSIRCTWNGEEIYSRAAAYVQTRGAVVVGVYEGSYPVGREGKVYVTVSGDTGESRDLILTAYEPVNWIVSVPSHVTLSKVILLGYHEQRITGLPSGVSVERHSYNTDGIYRYGYQVNTDAYRDLAKWVEARYPNNWTFQSGGYTGYSVNVYVGYKG